ncbi:hypothetical protein RE9414_26060 [Prescottella equi]|nr:hypothetical protein RE9414_26060 [Prescottella equi]
MESRGPLRSIPVVSAPGARAWWWCPDGRGGTDCGDNGGMPLIQISQTPGLSAEQKRETIAAVTKAYAEATGKNASSVWVTITEVPREHWGVGGEPLG